LVVLHPDCPSHNPPNGTHPFSQTFLGVDPHGLFMERPPNQTLGGQGFLRLEGGMGYFFGLFLFFPILYFRGFPPNPARLSNNTLSKVFTHETFTLKFFFDNHPLKTVFPCPFFSRVVLIKPWCLFYWYSCAQFIPLFQTHPDIPCISCHPHFLL